MRSLAPLLTVFLGLAPARAAVGTAVESTFLFEPAEFASKGAEGLAQQDSVFVRPAPPSSEPDETLDLSAAFNKNWDADAFPTGEGPAMVGTQFDAKGDAYLSVTLPHAQVATYYKYEAGMSAAWQVGNEVYEMWLDVSIFRARTSNFVMVKRRSDGRTVYKRRIKEILLRTYPKGQTVSIGGREYKVFFSFSLIPGDPARTDVNNYTLALVTNVGSGGDLDYRTYLIPFRDLQGSGTVSYTLYGGERIRLRARTDPPELDVFVP
ncbi:hypothetical protein EPO15_01460 [bacterium]|nr:MAG: hypothetical protein EPO15_01460 [bacterium]